MTPAGVDQGTPLTVTEFEARRRNQVTLKELLYGTGSYTGQIPHDHDGAEDAPVPPAFSPNLVNDGCPDNDATSAWTRDGYTVEPNKGFLTTTTANNSAYQVLCRQAAASKLALSSADITLAIFVRAKSTVPSAGELHFGLSDGNTTFKASCKGVIAFGSITSSYRRFYMTIAAATVGALGTDCRFLIKNHSTPPNQKLIVTAIGAWAGKVLPYWEPGLLESESTHDDWKKYGLSDCPIYDERVAITQAVAVTGA